MPSGDIRISSNFALSSQRPLDDRTVLENDTERLALTLDRRYHLLRVDIEDTALAWQLVLGTVDQDLMNNGNWIQLVRGAIQADGVGLEAAITLAGTSYGSYPDGTTVDKDTSMQTIFENMFRVSVPPIYYQPTVNLTPNNVYLEVGTIINFTLNTVFTQNDAGSINRYKLDKNYNSSNVNLVDEGNISEYLDNTSDPVLVGSDLVYTAEVFYDEGITKDDNLGVPIPEGKILAGSKIDTFTVVGVRAYFYNADTSIVAPTSSEEIRVLGGGMGAVNGTTFTIHIPTGTTRIVFSYPATLRDVSTVKYVELGNGEVKDTFALSTVVVDGASGYQGIDYKTYTYLPAVPFGDAATYIVTI